MIKILLTLVLLLALPALAAPGKAPAAGIVYLVGNETNTERSFSNPAVSGVKLRVGWNEVESEPGKYDFAVIDRFFASARAHGKFLSLAVIAGRRSPRWLLEDSTVQRLSSNDPPPRRPIVMPAPWDPKYLAAWERFLKVLSERYDARPELAYLSSSGYGYGPETILPEKTGFESNTLPVWLAAAKKIVDFHGRAFRQTPFTLVIHNILRKLDTTAILTELVDYGFATYPARFGLENDGLKATTEDHAGRDSEWPVNALIHRHAKAGQFVGYQMTCSTIANPMCKPKWVEGSLEQALRAGVAMGAHYIEVYPDDCDNPANRVALKAADVALKKNAATP